MSEEAPVDFISLPTGRGFFCFVVLAWWPCIESLLFVYMAVSVHCLPTGYGIMTDGYTTYINASTCTVSFQPTNPPIIFDLPNPQNSWSSECPTGMWGKVYKLPLFLIINLHSLTCLFPNAVSSFCKLLEQQQQQNDAKGCASSLLLLLFLFLNGVSIWNQRSIVNL